ncbi:lytB 4-Hydroxy-3-methylbut-2-enyl diphosphate reductase IspH [Candidatus Pelagibacterales bacterium]
MEQKIVNVFLASPRGFCAGVDRAVEIVKKTISKFGSPVYVRHEIVHNKFVVENLKSEGAVFIEELSEIENKSRPVIFSAHGVPKRVIDEAKLNNIIYIDATCPLVTKVHREAEALAKEEFNIIFIGHRNHPEVVGTMGQIDQRFISLVENKLDVENYSPKINNNKFAYITQTTLSLDDTLEIISILKQKYPSIKEPIKSDICYATTNRQEAVKKIAKNCDLFLVIGSRSSSNSQRLVEVAKKFGCKESLLMHSEQKLPTDKIRNANNIGITSGASAPEILVENLIKEIKSIINIRVEEVISSVEKVSFKLPTMLMK